MSRISRLALALALLNLLAHFGAVGWATTVVPVVAWANWVAVTAMTLPHALTLAAALLVWGDRSAVPLAVALGNGLLLIDGLFLLDRVSGLNIAGQSLVLSWFNLFVASGYPGVSLAPVVFFPALVGWWQRRGQSADEAKSVEDG